MKTIRIPVVISLICLLNSCFIASLNPLYTESTRAFEENLIGEWKDAQATWKFEAKKDQSYKLTFTDSMNQAIFIAQLVEIKGLNFLDISLSPEELNNSLSFATHFPVHSFWKIEIEEQQIKLQTIDFEALMKAAKNNTLDVPYVLSQNDDILLTGTSEELQKFVIQNPQLFGKQSIYTKSKH